MSIIRKASLTILEKDGKILFLKRQNTGFSDGFYTLPSGKVDINESFLEAAVRETLEEVNVLIDPIDLRSVYIMLEKNSNEEWLHHFFLCKIWDGEIKNMEENKCSEVKWFELDKLPDNIMPIVKIALDKVYVENCCFSERVREMKF